MNEQERRAIVDRYLDDLRRELGGVPADRQRELVDDVRGHIEEAWSEAASHDEATLLNILERLGEPSALAREERDRLGLFDAPVHQGPGVLEIAAIVLTVLFWPVGVILAWLSPRWTGMDKLVATAMPLVGLALVMSASMVAYTSTSPSAASVVVQKVEVGSSTQSPQEGQAEPPAAQPAEPVPPTSSTRHSILADVVARVAVLFGLIGAPITSGLYLALRIGPRPRKAALLLPAGTILLVLAAVIAALSAVPA